MFYPTEYLTLLTMRSEAKGVPNTRAPGNSPVWNKNNKLKKKRHNRLEVLHNNNAITLNFCVTAVECVSAMDQRTAPNVT